MRRPLHNGPVAERATSWRRRLGWRLEAAGYDLASAILRRLPLDGVSAFGGRLLRTLGPLTDAHRTARLGLALAFPELSPEARADILAAQWDNFGRYLCEFPLMDRLTPAGGRVEIVGGERLAAIAASGRPTVLISGHFSNFEVMAAAIVAAGIACEVTYRPANNPLIDERIRTSRRRYGVSLFAPKGAEGARDLLEALKAGRSIALLNDQRYDAGEAALFFGHPAPTNPAAARLAIRFGAPIVPLSIERLAGARFRCIVHPPIEPASTGQRAADIAAAVARINTFLEDRVRARPGEWWWLHRRWPSEVYEAAARAASHARRAVLPGPGARP